MIVDIHSQLGEHPLYPFQQSVEDIINDMDKYNIDMSFLLPVPRMRFQEANNKVAEKVDEHPNRFIGFFNVNPVDPVALTEIDRALEMKMKGLLLDPEFHISMERPITPGNKNLSSIFEKSVDNNLPILISIPNIRVGHSHDNALNMKIGLDELLSRFPEVITLVDLFWPDIIELCMKHKNLYVDTAGASAGRITDLVDKLGATRILFGSNSPRYHPGNHKKTVEWSNISEEQKKLILGGNAKRIFNKFF